MFWKQLSLDSTTQVCRKKNCKFERGMSLLKQTTTIKKIGFNYHVLISVFA